jgi:hypothetical protein
LAGGCPGFPLVTRQACLRRDACRVRVRGPGRRARPRKSSSLMPAASPSRSWRVPLAGDQFGVAGGEAAVAVFLPAADQYPHVRGAGVQAPVPGLAGGHLVRQGYLRAGMRGEDQPVQPLEQRPVPWRYPVDVGLHLWRHDGGHVPGLRFDPVLCSAARTPNRGLRAAALSAARPPSASGRWDPATRTSAAPGRPSATPPRQHPVRGTAKRREWHRCRRWSA